MSKPIEELLPEKPKFRLSIYAWSTKEIKKYDGCLKVGQTTQDVNIRIRQSQGVAQYQYILEVHESAEREDGTLFRDSTVRERLKQKGFENVELEWMRCKAEDVQTAIKELQTGAIRTGSHNEDFKMRNEQIAAVKKTADLNKDGKVDVADAKEAVQKTATKVKASAKKMTSKKKK